MKMKTTHLAAIAALAMAGAASAATITYSTQVISSSADTSWVTPTNTTSLTRFNFGGDETTYASLIWLDTTDAGGWTCGNPTVSPWANFSAPGVGWGSSVSTFYNAAGPALLHDGAYMSSTTGEVDIGNLTVGKHYQIQFVLADTRNEAYAIGRTIQIQGLGTQAGQNSTAVQYGYGDSRFAVVTADFVADATQFNFIPYQAGSGATNGTGTQINAVQVLEVIPEPSAAALGLLAAGGLLLRRRRA